MVHVNTPVHTHEHTCVCVCEIERVKKCLFSGRRGGKSFPVLKGVSLPVSNNVFTFFLLLTFFFSHLTSIFFEIGFSSKNHSHQR